MKSVLTRGCFFICKYRHRMAMFMAHKCVLSATWTRKLNQYSSASLLSAFPGFHPADKGLHRCMHRALIRQAGEGFFIGWVFLLAGCFCYLGWNGRRK